MASTALWELLILALRFVEMVCLFFPNNVMTVTPYQQTVALDVSLKPTETVIQLLNLLIVMYVETKVEDLQNCVMTGTAQMVKDVRLIVPRLFQHGFVL